ncbi:MAG: hypothetical protein AB1635_07505 [Acidobacteriota bacterium]
MSSATMAPPGSTRLLLAMGGLLAVAIALQVVRDRGWQPYEPATPLLWVQSPEAVARASLGHRNLVADVYWIRAVVYYGSQRLSGRGADYGLLYPLLDFVTTLDPRFRIAYRFGAIFLAEGYPRGPGRPDLAIRLLEKGVAADPARWEYVQDIGFVYYWWLRDARAAAEWFQRASAVPGAPSWLRLLAATTFASGGDRRSSRQLWQQLQDTADNDWLRRTAAMRLAQLDAMDLLDRLNAAADRVRGVPVDPAGVPFERDADGRFRLSPQSPLWPLPQEPPATP